jgi:ribonuclease P protein component
VLPARNRLRESGQFRAVLRGPGGSRAGGPLMVVHAAMTDPMGARAPRVGFVVSGAVGGAVVRNRVERRLRALAGTALGGIPAGCDLVVRAAPAAATASFAELQAELDRCLRRALAKVA